MVKDVIKGDDYPEAKKVNKIMEDLKRTNKEMEKLLFKLPLSDHNEIARMDYLVRRQLRLMEIVIPRNVPQRILIHLDNVKDTALLLRERYSTALHTGKIRKPVEEE